MTISEIELLELCHQNRCNVDLVTGYDEVGGFKFAVRLRPWKQNPRSPVMVIAQGKTLREGLDNATQLASTAQWVSLDWAGRPWPSSRMGGGTWSDNAIGPAPF